MAGSALVLRVWTNSPEGSAHSRTTSSVKIAATTPAFPERAAGGAAETPAGSEMLPSRRRVWANSPAGDATSRIAAIATRLRIIAVRGRARSELLREWLRALPPEEQDE